MNRFAPHEAVVSDPRKFQRVILNLATNAIKFTPQGGHVNLQIEKLVPPVAGKNYRIIVKDDGIGMAKLRIHKLMSYW